MKDVLYLGPKGSYSEIALDKFKKIFSENVQTIPQDSIYKIIRTLKNTQQDDICAVIPIENSIEGVVRDTQDNLYDLALNGYRIYAETQLPIKHTLIGFGTKSEIKVINLTHKHWRNVESIFIVIGGMKLSLFQHYQLLMRL